MTAAYLSRIVGLPLALCVAVTAQARAQDAAAGLPDTSAQKSAYSSSIAEQGVRGQTDKIRAEITELAAELKLNGMADTDLATLTNASDHLQNLSQQDMQKIVTALQSASLSAQDQNRQQTLVTAYQGQEVVLLKLKSLATELAAREAQREVLSRLENLIARQSANIRATEPLSRAVANHLNPKLRATHDVVSAEQTAIGGEVDLLYKIVSAPPTAAAPGSEPASDVPDIGKTILAAMSGESLKALTDAATMATTVGPFPDAVTRQGDVRNALSSLLRASLADMDAVSGLQQAKTELDQLTADQKDLGATTPDSKLDPTTLAERQAKISDRTAVTQALLKALSPEASTQLAVAEQAMQQDSTALAAAKNPADSAALQQAAVDALQKTASLLDQQMASAEKEQAMAPTDKLAQLQQLQSDLQQAQQNPQAASLQNVQQEAAAVSPQAANKIADASDQLQQPQPNAAAAQQDLAQANAAVQQQANAMKQAAQDDQALTQASQQLQQAQAQAAAADQALQQNKSGDLTQAAKELNQAQAALAQAQKTPAQGALPPNAKQALQQAADALKAATTQAVQAQGANAEAQDQKAMAAMQQAQKGLGQAMAQMQQQAQGRGPGQPQGQAQGQDQDPSSQPGKGMSLAGTDENPNDVNNVLNGRGPSGGVGQVVGALKPKDRDAISQFQAEKSPPEYAPLAQQYLKNLADSGQAH